MADCGSISPFRRAIFSSTALIRTGKVSGESVGGDRRVDRRRDYELVTGARGTGGRTLRSRL